ncbi:hypothetical protein BJ878DRAFT_419148 [Calycina marina]|uniref:Uncharacterized protein n=1 Tax=Calycina marina TaxID=1763456 RepID=A0A9P7Z5Y2_9HELO|nr:hypothetical protein BJ878DRAFT_419148 [Calycina marina]
MVSIRSILAAGCLVNIVAYAAPVPSSVEQIFPRTSYVTYGGDGDTDEGWPAQSTWVDFDTMWTVNQPTLTSGCGWRADQLPENSPTELSDLKSAITTVAASSGVDSRFILAIVLQESNGCVRVHSTANGVSNPGLMQSHSGAGTCNSGDDKQDPCPQTEILQMIKDGTEGTATGDGLVQILESTGATDVSQFYKAARVYNSGSISVSKNLGDGNGATACYSSDIANKLTGFGGTSACSSTVVESLDSTPGTAADATSDTPAVSSPSASIAGGAFAQEPASSSVPPVPSSTPSAIEVAPAVQASPTETPVAVAPSPVTVPETATVAPVAAASAEPSPAAISSPEPSFTPASTPVTTSGAQTPGSACATEGTWNCINSTTFQQCASGVWSVTQSLATGMRCTVGMSTVFSVSAIAKQ